MDQLATWGFSFEAIESDITSTLHTTPQQQQAQDIVRRRFQTSVIAIALARLPGGPYHAVQRRLIRWLHHSRAESRLLTPVAAARACHTNILRLHKLVTPNVVASVFSILWNRLMTTRRLRKGNGSCLFRCRDAGPDDSLEHYVYCPVIRRFACDTLCLDDSLLDSWGAFLCVRNTQTDTQLTLCALRLHALCHSHNHARQHALPPNFCFITHMRCVVQAVGFRSQRIRLERSSAKRAKLGRG